LRNDMMEFDPKPPAVQSISRAGNILQCLGNGVSTITEIARHCNLSKSTVHRLLKALEESLIVSQNPTNHRYYLGPLITQLASKPQNTHEYLITSSIDEMRRLSDISEETITISIMTGIQYVHLHEIQSRHDLRVTEEGRKTRPLFVGATTKVLLSQFDDNELKIAIKNINITPATTKTVTNKNVLMAQLKEIRKRGYAVSYGETIVGALCTSAPIRNYGLPAALSIVGPESRLKPRVNGLVKELQASADLISKKIAGIFGTKEVRLSQSAGGLL